MNVLRSWSSSGGWFKKSAGDPPSNTARRRALWSSCSLSSTEVTVVSYLALYKAAARAPSPKKVAIHGDSAFFGSPSCGGALRIL